MTISEATMGMARDLVASGAKLVALDRPLRAPNPKSMDGDFIPAPELARLGAELQARHHLPTECIVIYRWKQAGGDSGGKKTLGKCVKLSGLARHLTEADYCIWLAADHCQGMTPTQIEALLFHELLHITLDDKLKPQIRPHDAEFFNWELAEYGPWSLDLDRVVQTVRQLPLVDRETGELLG